MILFLVRTLQNIASYTTLLMRVAICLLAAVRPNLRFPVLQTMRLADRASRSGALEASRLSVLSSNPAPRKGARKKKPGPPLSDV